MAVSGWYFFSKSLQSANGSSFEKVFVICRSSFTIEKSIVIYALRALDIQTSRVSEFDGVPVDALHLVVGA